MLRLIVLRLGMMPLLLLLANAFGYLFALVVRQNRTTAEGLSPGAMRPLFGAYGDYLSGVRGGDFGVLPYASSSEDVADIIARTAGASLGLLAIALVLSIVVGMGLGLAAVRTEPPGVALWLTSFSTISLSMPGFYLGGLFIAGTIIYIIYGPGTTTRPPLPIQGFGWDSHLVLPALVLLLQPAAKIAQVTASLLAGELNKQYVVAARSIGHSWKRIVRRYALRNILAAVIVSIAGSFRLMVGELIIVERLFRWPGMGRLISQTLVPPAIVQARENVLYLSPPVIAAIATVLAALFLVVDLMAAVVARIYDPRLRTS